jgi:hypothetical protein
MSTCGVCQTVHSSVTSKPIVHLRVTNSGMMDYGSKRDSLQEKNLLETSESVRVAVAAVYICRQVVFCNSH